MASLVIDIPQDFVDFCALENLSPEDVIFKFAVDLADVHQRGGRVQHRAAETWFDANPWPQRQDD